MARMAFPEPMLATDGMETGVGVLAALDELDGPSVALAGEWIAVRVLTKRHADRSVFLVVRERDGDRLFRIRTEWCGGWLDPVVDVADATAEEATFEPAGGLRAVRASGWTGSFARSGPDGQTTDEVEPTDPYRPRE